jgi:hypothetical protein
VDGIEDFPFSITVRADDVNKPSANVTRSIGNMSTAMAYPANLTQLRPTARAKVGFFSNQKWVIRQRHNRRDKNRLQSTLTTH